MELSVQDIRNAAAAQRVIRALEMRHMEGYYAATKAEALKKALELIPEGSSVGWGGCRSAEEIGLIDAVCSGNYAELDRSKAANQKERYEIMNRCLTADWFIMGTNAITEDGQLVNLDGMGNRVAALCYGPRKVLIIAGMNKLVRSVDDAVSRTRHTAAPINAARFDIDTPCKQTGVCGDCLKDGCICSQLVITRNCKPNGRIKVILVGESLGF
ncbi:MAG: lactate utilization protein [Oscillospiraceae bacterium]|nr:lactate utilization protein [Oscillospiraceae bacterium]